MKLIRLKCDDSVCEHWPDEDGGLCDYDDAVAIISGLKADLAGWRRELNAADAENAQLREAATELLEGISIYGSPQTIDISNMNEALKKTTDPATDETAEPRIEYGRDGRI